MLLAVMPFEKSAYWKMTSFSSEPPRTQLWFRLTELNSFSLVAPGARRAVVGGAVGLRVLVAAVAHRQVLVGGDVGRHLDVEQRLAVGRGEDAVERREQALGVDDLERVLLGALHGAEVVHPVLDDRPAEAAAELVAAVVALVRAGVLLGGRRGVHAFVTEQLEEAAAQRVGAALGDDVHHAAVAAAVLGLGARGDEVELLDGFQGEELQQAADGVVVVVAAVDLVVDVAAVAAVDLRRVPGCSWSGRSGCRGRRRAAWRRGWRTGGR